MFLKKVKRKKKQFLHCMDHWSTYGEERLFPEGDIWGKFRSILRVDAIPRSEQCKKMKHQACFGEHVMFFG